MKNPFWESDDKPKAVAPQPAHAASFINPSTQPSYSSPTQNFDNLDLVVSAKQKLNDAIKNNKPAGIGYLEYLDSKNEMAELPDEGKRYSMTFKIMKSAGLTKPTLISSAQAAMSLVTNSKNGFESAFNQSLKTQVSDKRTQAQSKQQQIQQLTNDVAQLNAEADHAEASMTQQHGAFVTAADQIINSIQSDIDKINQYIQ